jgi:hypothetical protein
MIEYKTVKQSKDNAKYKSVLYLIGTREEFDELFRQKRYSTFSMPNENIIGYLLVPLERIIKLYEKLNNHLTNKYIPLRQMWSQVQENRDNSEIRTKFVNQYINYLSGLCGNHSGKIKKIKEGEYGRPEFPTIYPIDWKG